MNPKYLEILACPACKGRLSYDDNAQHLICHIEKTAYPIIDGIMMLERNYVIDLTTTQTNQAAADNSNALPNNRHTAL